VNTASASPASPSSLTQAPSSTGPAGRPTLIPGGPWGAELINRQALVQGSLTGSGDSLYAFTGSYLVRIDPATGDVVRTAPYSSPVMNPPVVLGNTVWVVSSYSGGIAVLHGYDARTLARVASVTVPALGQVSSAAQGVLTAGPDGHLYLAAGDSVAVVNPANGVVIRRTQLVAGPASSVAVSPDGSRLYVSMFLGESFRLLTYDLATGVQVGASSADAGAGGNLVATSGGVWGTLGSGMSEWVWFAPGGDLSPYSRVTQGAGGGLVSVPALSGGTVWIGGSHSLVCADPATGQVRANAIIPTDNGVVEYIGSVTVTGGHAYAYYQDERGQQAGVVTLTPPATCSG
jgi:hypothetical protein